MNEPIAADQWIYSTLKADAALTAVIGGASAPRIYNTQAPQNGAGDRMAVRRVPDAGRVPT